MVLKDVDSDQGFVYNIMYFQKVQYTLNIINVLDLIGCVDIKPLFTVQATRYFGRQPASVKCLPPRILFFIFQALSTCITNIHIT